MLIFFIPLNNCQHSFRFLVQSDSAFYVVQTFSIYVHINRIKDKPYKIVSTDRKTFHKIQHHFLIKSLNKLGKLLYFF